MTNTIIPSVGRKVWYRPCENDLKGPVPMAVLGSIAADTAQPLDATIVAVHSDRMVNVLVKDAYGRQFPVLSVTLLQPGDCPAVDGKGRPCGRYVEWMPFQVSQAKTQGEPK